MIAGRKEEAFLSSDERPARHNQRLRAAFLQGAEEGSVNVIR